METKLKPMQRREVDDSSFLILYKKDRDFYALCVTHGLTDNCPEVIFAVGTGFSGRLSLKDN